MSIFYFVLFAFLMILLSVVMFLYLKGYFSCSPLGAKVVPIAGEEQLQHKYPDLKLLYTRWVELKTELVHQDWHWNKWTRPAHPMRAFAYRFIFPNKWQKKVDKCEQARSEYIMCSRLLDDY